MGSQKFGDTKFQSTSPLHLVNKSCTIRYVSIPTLALTATTLSLKISKMLQKEHDPELTCDMTEYY